MRLEFVRALFCLLLFMAAFFCGASASINITTTTSLTINNDTNKPESKSPTTKPDTTVNSTTEAPNTSTTGSTSSGTSTLPTVRTDTSPAAISPPASSSGVPTAVGLIFLFCVLTLLFFYAFKWYVRNGRPSPVEIGRSLAEYMRNVWAAAVEHLRPTSKDEEEHDYEEIEAGVQTAEDQNNREGDAEDDSDDDSSDYSNVPVFVPEWTKKGEEIDSQGNEGEDELSSVELKDETERMKDDLTVL